MFLSLAVLSRYLPEEFMTVFVPLDRIKSLSFQVEVADQRGITVSETITRDRQIAKTNTLNFWKERRSLL